MFFSFFTLLKKKKESMVFPMGIATQEIRKKAIAAYKTGRYSQRHLADVYGVHIKTIANWIRIERTEQRLSPLPRGHNPEAFNTEDKQSLVQLVRENPHLTLAQIRECLNKSCSLQTIHNTLARLGIRMRKYEPARRRVDKAAGKRVKSAVDRAPGKAPHDESPG